MHTEQLNGKPPKPFSQRLKSLRASKSLTQESCAILLGVSKRCLEEWEYGNTEPSEATQQGAEMILRKQKKRETKRKETK